MCEVRYSQWTRQSGGSDPVPVVTLSRFGQITLKIRILWDSRGATRTVLPLLAGSWFQMSGQEKGILLSLSFLSCGRHEQ